MTTTEAVFFRSQLLDRRSRLEAVPLETREAARLLGEIDAALERIEQGTYGLCENCHDPVEPERLLADPLVRFCLDHLSEPEQKALQQDLDLALRIQATLLPGRNPETHGWETHYHYSPCGPVGGDFCDLVECGEDLLFVTGDVAGKGVAASLLMSHLHAILRTLAPMRLPLPELMARANAVFSRSTMPAHYATLVCGMGRADGTVEIVNGGHCPPLLLRDGAVTALEATGLPLGLFADGQYESECVRFDRGDSLVLYTDGLTEARDPSGAEYGVERLSSRLGGCRGLSAAALAASCVADLERFLSGAARHDDLTVMVLRRA